MTWDTLTRQAREATYTLLHSANPPEGALMVVGCSTSEVIGQHIGSASNEDVARAIMDGLLDAVQAKNLFVAVQGCEHINRALCVSRACVNQYGLQEVWVRPWLRAGGAFVSEAMERFHHPVMVENLLAKASLGMDIGGTLIGMHMRSVVVPVHTEMRTLGQATLILARTRPPYIGGPRSRYEPDDNPHK